MASSNPDQPQRWQTILISQTRAKLPFRVFFDELSPAAPSSVEERAMPSGVDVEIMLRARVVEPVEGWMTFQQRRWGEEGHLITDWFEAGDKQGCSTDLVVEEPEPERWDRALQWVRSLAVATRLIPA